LAVFYLAEKLKGEVHIFSFYPCHIAFGEIAFGGDISGKLRDRSPYTFIDIDGDKAAHLNS
jgi:hypothetical protein